MSAARETIAAIATPAGGGIGIVRISGPLAEDIVRRLVVPFPAKAQSHKLHLAKLKDPSTGEVIDEVLAVIMRRPRSYTGEDVAELHAHGGPRVLERVLDAVLRVGARQAEPGEFTRRAFEAGRIDLSRAEAIAEVIAARSDRALRAARQILDGKLADAIGAARQALVLALAELEGALDFPDDVAEEAPTEARSVAALALVRAQIEALAASHRRFEHERAEVVLVGRVNAGKSSLFNALVGEERALVDDTPGTTRDVLEAELLLGGTAVRLVDTAGERGAVDEAAAERLEARGVALGRRRRARADVAILVVDGAAGWSDDDAALFAALEGRPRIIVWNKSDRAPVAAAPSWAAGAPIVSTSVAPETAARGLDALERAVVDALGEGDEDSSRLQIGLRQRGALLDAAAALVRAEETLASGGPADVAAVEARGALEHLGRVTGETVDNEILDAIFARFCIGK
jgi:tRNA modification GTPase